MKNALILKRCFIVPQCLVTIKLLRGVNDQSTIFKAFFHSKKKKLYKILRLNQISSRLETTVGFKTLMRSHDKAGIIKISMKYKYMWHGAPGASDHSISKRENEF